MQLSLNDSLAPLRPDFPVCLGRGALWVHGAIQHEKILSIKERIFCGVGAETWTGGERRMGARNAHNKYYDPGSGDWEEGRPGILQLNADVNKWPPVNWPLTLVISIILTLNTLINHNIQGGRLQVTLANGVISSILSGNSYLSCVKRFNKTNR